ncbi:ribosomal protein S18-alanine N-acetyltransferase [Frigidibacter sp. RF13]|uniref:ribosomal protein S18-alanine N-acetyltransferase n=1 Tax=Frigidibacter sp. RF13 TaxID=2997340 RepID=UPI00226DDB38|nr:ribosomal protein S18-alanine N-acetyltransferase [Frigidibacter sp. RF13]MCY1126189.1 ribosomal protein S18-alanine N-acetyltransferase [Frigidibacter sp. RF13]
MRPSAEALAALHAAAFTFPRPWSAAEIAQLLDDPLCFLSHRADGFALGRAVAGEAELLTIAVHPDAQGRGVGGALLAELIGHARSRAAERMFLEVAAGNESAIRLYLAAGFTRIGVRRGYFADEATRIDALVMARDLGAAAP